MAEISTDKVHREWNLTNSDSNYSNGNTRSRHLSQTQSLQRKISDQNPQHHHAHNQHQSSVQSPPAITTTDYSDPTSLSVMRVSQSFPTRRNSDTGYDTDGGIGTTNSTTRSRRQDNHGYDHLVSPRLPTKRSTLHTSKAAAATSMSHHSPHYAHLSVNPTASVGHHHSEKADESSEGEHSHRHHIRASRRIQHRSPANRNHGASTVPRHNTALANTTSGRPFRLVFIRHSERANQALGSDWFSKAFRTNTYKSYDPNLPMVLPKRHSDHAYEFDAPITVHGLKIARHTGRAMSSTGLVADVCLSSTALRCIQTAERVLTGMERADQVPIRVEPGLFECPHLNHKIVDSFMTKKELIDNGYQIKAEYKPLIPKVGVPESLNEYFDRCVTVMRGIIDRYGNYGGTILVVTHAPGLLALTDAIKGKRPDHETFYRTVAAYPPLAIYIAEYDGAKWKHSEQPFSIIPVTK